MITLNGVKVTPTIFPDRTSQVWSVLYDAQYNINQFVNCVEWRFEQEAELIHLAQLRDLLSNTTSKAILNIPYLPYARQDKEICDNRTFALHTFCKMLNLQAWDEVFLFDPHNKGFVRRGINNARIIEPNLSFTYEYDYAVLPDYGAYMRYKEFVAQPESRIIYGEKVRNLETGKIESYKLVDSKNRKFENYDFLADKKIIVVDDLCDGGATFEILGVELNHFKIKVRPDLYVSHGLFSKGVTELLKYYGKIITTHSILDTSDLETAAKQSLKYKSILDAVNEGRLVFNDVNHKIVFGT